ncbi:hypothetical protein, partial [Burkholderia sp. Ac-20379]|uniref:hypothetical protein n=1 Tax=Burkholderia sp. Ac-20379 TaxID=2703900 RepID=UPI00197D5C78
MKVSRKVGTFILASRAGRCRRRFRGLKSLAGRAIRTIGKAGGAPPRRPEAGPEQRWNEAALASRFAPRPAQGASSATTSSSV